MWSIIFCGFVERILRNWVKIWVSFNTLDATVTDCALVVHFRNKWCLWVNLVQFGWIWSLSDVTIPCLSPLPLNLATPTKKSYKKSCDRFGSLQIRKSVLPTLYSALCLLQCEFWLRWRFHASTASKFSSKNKLIERQYWGSFISWRYWYQFFHVKFYFSLRYLFGHDSSQILRTFDDPLRHCSRFISLTPKSFGSRKIAPKISFTTMASQRSEIMFYNRCAVEYAFYRLNLTV